jgi:hypothetical protein
MLIDSWYDGTTIHLRIGSAVAQTVTSANIAGTRTSSVNIGSNNTKSCTAKIAYLVVKNAAMSAGQQADSRAYLANVYGVAV